MSKPSHFQELIHSLIRTFSYRGKWRFILFWSYLPAIILLVAIPLLLNRPIQNLQCKVLAMAKLNEAANHYLQTLSPEAIPNLEKGMASLKQDPKLACAFSPLLLDNSGRRVLEATNRELPDIRSTIASIAAATYSTPQKSGELSGQFIEQLYADRLKLSEGVERIGEDQELSPIEIDAWKGKMAAFDSLLTKVNTFKTAAEVAQPALSLLRDTVELQIKLYQLCAQNLNIQLQSLKRARLISLLSLIAGGLIAALIYFGERMRHPLSDVTKGLQELSKGSYVQLPIPSRGEMVPIIAGVNQLSDYLKGFWKDTSGIKERLKDALENIRLTSTQLEENIEGRTATTRQISSGSGEILTSVQTLSDELIGASRSAIATGALASTGEEGLHQMETIMQEMLTASSDIVITLSALQDEVGSINNVITAIVKIADQSNLLSLNTAIRASKSGLQGRGFTVIAERIREMADQIALATLDIEKSVQEIVKAVLEAAEGVNAFSEHIRNQVRETDGLSTQLKQLIGDTQGQVYRFERIKAEIQMQMQQISHIKQVTSDLKKGSTASHQLARSLSSELHHFKTQVGT